MKAIVKSVIASIFILQLIACKKNIDSEGLPKETHSGSNTFGFLLNGEAWTPRGSGASPNLVLTYDPELYGGTFNLGAYRSGEDAGQLENLVMYGDSVQGPQKIILPSASAAKFGFLFGDQAKSCIYSSRDSLTELISGYFDLKVLDKQK